MTIKKEPGLIAPNLYMIDTLQFNVSHITTVFCYFDGTNGLLIDIGTSDNVTTVLRSLRKMNIPLEKIQGVTLSHYHFDHAGGATKLWKKMVKKNPHFKIYTSSYTRNKLQKAESHRVGATTTFGEFVGTMNPIPEELINDAYHIVEPDSYIPITFQGGVRIKLIAAPGHSPDHVAPAVFQASAEKPDFVFAGEATGTFYNESELISTSTSMPPNYQHSIYMKSLEKLIELNPKSMGVCHYGAIQGEEQVHQFLVDHRKFMQELYSAIKNHYTEKPSIPYVITKLEEEKLHVKNRVGDRFTDDPVSRHFISNLQLALTYGILIDQGFRESKYEPRDVK